MSNYVLFDFFGTTSPPRARSYCLSLIWRRDETSFFVAEFSRCWKTLGLTYIIGLRIKKKGEIFFLFTKCDILIISRSYLKIIDDEVNEIRTYGPEF